MDLNSGVVLMLQRSIILNSSKTSKKRLKILKIEIYNLIKESDVTFSQNQLPHKMTSRLVIVECAGYIFWLLFLQRIEIVKCTSCTI